ncbi:MAG: nucleotidyltransferase family protein [Deltaproteobacteria bacterium]|nr:nucleotidyltransferase family protein [Deltaproteobacteria bacterium]
MKGPSTATENLMLCLINPGAKKGEIETLLADEIDWKDFQEKSYAHRIAPLIYYNLKKLDLLFVVPKTVIHTLERTYVYTLKTNIMFGEELKGILANFHDRGISCIILKGLAFIETIYHENPGVRPLKDMDLLLRKEDVKKAGLVLKEMGYQLYEGYRPEAFYWESHFHLPFQKRGKSTHFHVEIHWHLLEPGIPVSLDVKSFWHRAVETVFLGAKANTLHPEDALIYLIWHTSLNGFDELLSFADLLYLIKYHSPSRNEVIKQMKDAHLTIPLYWGSYITSELFNLDLVPTPRIDPLSKIFGKVFFTKKNMMEQFVRSDWPILPLVHLFMFENKLYGVKNIFDRVPPFPGGLKVMVHYVCCFMRIWLRYVQARG